MRAIVPYNFPLTLMGTKIGPTFSAMVDATFESPESNRRFYLAFFDFLGYAVRTDCFGDVGAIFHEICNGLTPMS